MTDELTALRARVAELEAELAIERAPTDDGTIYLPPMRTFPIKVRITGFEPGKLAVPQPDDADPDPRDTSLPWPCTCGRTDTNGCDRCDPRDARIAELEVALRELEALSEKILLDDTNVAGLMSAADVHAISEEALGDAHG